MPELPKRKVGIVACSGEELAEGTVTRLAALNVLHELRPGDTVTICLPLFLAGGEGERSFARFHPTIAVDGCEKRCAALGTAMYSGEPAAGVVVTDLARARGIGPIQGRQRLNAAGRDAVDATAERLAELVDGLLSHRRRASPAAPTREASAAEQAQFSAPACACGSRLPVQALVIEERAVTLTALPLLFEQFCGLGKKPGDDTTRELLEMVRVYNAIPQGSENAYAAAVADGYARFLKEKEAGS